MCTHIDAGVQTKAIENGSVNCALKSTVARRDVVAGETTRGETCVGRRKLTMRGTGNRARGPNASVKKNPPLSEPGLSAKCL